MNSSSAYRIAGLFSLLALACILRCDRLGLPQLSSDESFSWRLTTYSTSELLQHMPGDAHPPLYYMILKGWTALLGDSPVALRSLSVFFALASILVLFALCREAGVCASGAFFAALLFALHLAPVDEPSRNARMYSQGVFLAGLTSWLLLRALRSNRALDGWWLGYGLAVAAFCYTHYYAFFTVAAQTLFVGGDLALHAFKRSVVSVRASLLGFLLAGGLALLLFIPWLPVWWKQTMDVKQGFWIQPVTYDHAKRVFFTWSSGLAYGDAVDLYCWSLLLLGGILWVATRGDRAGLFFLLQASLPWLLSLAISSFSDRPIFHERYLAFAQFFLFPFWGIVWDRLPGWLPRLGLSCFLVAVTLNGLWATRAQWPERPPALAEAATFLRLQYRDGDVVLSASPGELNRLRYYAAQVGLATIQVRCQLSPFQPAGHIVHLGSLQAEDIQWLGLSSEPRVSGRIWMTGNASVPPDAKCRVMGQWSFDGDGGGVSLILFECP
jgi:mannosyltransferase